MAQAFRIVAVFLYPAVCALCPDLLVFAIVEIPAGSGFGFLFQYTSLFAVGKDISSLVPVFREFFRMDELILFIIGVNGFGILVFTRFFLPDPVPGSIVIIAEYCTLPVFFQKLSSHVILIPEGQQDVALA